MMRHRYAEMIQVGAFWLAVFSAIPGTGCTTLTAEEEAQNAMDFERARQERMYAPRIYDRDSLPGPGRE